MIIVILGGGPTLKDYDRDAYPPHQHILVNNSYKLAREGDVLFYGDEKWWEAYCVDVRRNFDGKIVTSAEHNMTAEKVPLGTKIEHMDQRPDCVFGADSGTKAMALAYRMGATKIILVGFDLSRGPDGETHWHGGHERNNDYCVQWRTFARTQGELYRYLREKGVEVYRAAPKGLKDIPYLGPQGLRNILGSV